jgi:hypothetical protein
MQHPLRLVCTAVLLWACSCGGSEVDSATTTDSETTTAVTTVTTTTQGPTTSSTTDPGPDGIEGMWLARARTGDLCLKMMGPGGLSIKTILAVRSTSAPTSSTGICSRCIPVLKLQVRHVRATRVPIGWLTTIGLTPCDFPQAGLKMNVNVEGMIWSHLSSSVSGDKYSKSGEGDL